MLVMDEAVGEDTWAFEVILGTEDGCWCRIEDHAFWLAADDWDIIEVDGYDVTDTEDSSTGHIGKGGGGGGGGSGGWAGGGRRRKVAPK